MVEQIRMIPVLLGESVKKVYPQEEKWHLNARKSLVAARELRQGDVITEKDIKIIRPGTGMHPQYLDMVIGRRLKCDLAENEIIPQNAI